MQTQVHLEGEGGELSRAGHLPPPPPTKGGASTTADRGGQGVEVCVWWVGWGGGGPGRKLKLQT